MYIDLIVWDVEDDPDGNYQHIVGAGQVTAEEVEEVLSNHHGNHPDAYSDTTGNPIIFGTTSRGQADRRRVQRRIGLRPGRHPARDGLDRAKK